MIEHDDLGPRCRPTPGPEPVELGSSLLFVVEDGGEIA
jgi:hypothetical protein